MATVERYSRGGYRVCYWLRLPGGRLRRYQYTPTRSRANLLRAQLGAVEGAVQVGTALLEDIREWVGRGWLAPEQAAAAFRAYRAAESPREPVDLDALLAAYEAYALRHSKAGDAGRKTHVSRMLLARQVVAWLAEAHPTLDLDAEAVQVWLGQLAARGYSEWSRHHYLTALRILLDQAVTLGMGESNPARAVRQGTPRRRVSRRILSVAEAQRLLACSLDHTGRLNGGLPLVVRLGLYAGLRPEEMCWLSWAALDLERGYLHVQETVAPHGEVWRPKDSEARVIDIKAELVAALQAERVRQEAAGLLGAFVLLGGHARKTQYRGRPLLPDKPQRAFREMIAEEGMDPRITVYSLRHTYCTALLRAGVDIETVRDRMGHSDIRTTQQYLHALAPEAHPSDALPY